MLSSHLQVSLNNLPIEQDKILEFTYSNSEYDWYPKATLKIIDIKGELLSQFYGLQIGSTAQILIYSDPEGEKRYLYQFPDLVVVSISEIIEDKNYFSGSIEILLTHPWELYKDFTSHAYAGKSNANIIRNLLEDSSQRGFKFGEINDDFWKNSDEDGSIPRYKCFESDFDFITKKLLPYTLCNNRVPFFWINERSEPCLMTFQDMYSRDSGALAVPNEPNFISQNSSKIETLLPKCRDLFFRYYSIFLKIGDDDPSIFTKMLKPRVVFENNLTGSFYAGIKKPKVAISKAKLSLTDGSKLPIDMGTFSIMSQSDAQLYRFKNLNDAIALSSNMQLNFNQFFRLNIMGDFAGDILTTGENINLLVPPIKRVEEIMLGLKKEKSRRHWIEDKWHIYGIKHFYNPSTTTVFTTLYLERPSFIYNKINTTLAAPDLLYSVMEA